MLADIGHVRNIPEFLSEVKDKGSHTKLMGFGHRVYKNYDPRAKIIQKACHDVLSELGIKDDPLLDLAMELEKIALNDKYFVDRKLYPNVDFYSGHHPEGDGLPDLHVHRAVRGQPHRRLDQPVDGDDGRPRAAHRPAAPDLHRRTEARLRDPRPAGLIGPLRLPSLSPRDGD